MHSSLKLKVNPYATVVSHCVKCTLPLAQLSCWVLPKLLQCLPLWTWHSSDTFHWVNRILLWCLPQVHDPLTYHTSLIEWTPQHWSGMSHLVTPALKVQMKHAGLCTVCVIQWRISSKASIHGQTHKGVHIVSFLPSQWTPITSPISFVRYT